LGGKKVSNKYNYSRQRNLPIKPIKRKGMKNVERKVYNNNSYTVGCRYSSWHNFVDTVAIVVVWTIVIAIVLAIAGIATIMIWA